MDQSHHGNKTRGGYQSPNLPPNEGGETLRETIHSPRILPRETMEGDIIGFLESPSSFVARGAIREQEIAENIFDWWISGKSYKKWYAERFLQQKIKFEQEQ